MPISKTSLLTLFTSAVAVLAQNGPPASHANKFSGLNVLDSAYSGASFGLNNIPQSSYSKYKWPWGTLPKNCYDIAVNNNYCNPYDVEAYDITYNDCPNNPAVVCRCNNAQVSIDTLAQKIGRIPVKARQWISHWTAWPASSCNAWYQNGHVTILGACTAQSVYFHEVGHGMDQYVAGPGNNYYSAGQEWKNKVNAGTCVPDSYAKSSWQESYAQVAVMAAYHGNVQSIWNLGVNCMADQMGRVNEQLIDTGIKAYKYQQGATCNRFWTRAQPVCMGPAARDAGNCQGVSSISTFSRVADTPEIKISDATAAAIDEERKKEAETKAQPWPAAKHSANEKKFSA
ncbi:hypothetical protein BJ508DRAFT_244123 [Ascobolus immersus RN42]|uniref:Uncharacterized protein n=1 Tax=Ascobolus immersus RN42 TaxID=1160509 RepID=A0A3N4HM61_ASCIM|nr:hypothetical protein BJ508DRAFT_244123 [Ascobolus immersus RN42]